MTSSVSPASVGGTGLTEKGIATRARILDTALRLFKERGFESTTMRDIARGSGVSLGNAYYYFPSKEHLIQGYYEMSHRDHLEACAVILNEETQLTRRLSKVVRAKIDSSMVYHRFAGVLFKTAADPRSPLSPFSPESAPVRADATRLMERVVTGSKQRVAPELADYLPNLLWLYLMGVIMFWIHDGSPGCQRTYRLIDATAPIVGKLIAASRFPPVRDFARAAARLLADLAEDMPGRKTSSAKS